MSTTALRTVNKLRQAEWDQGAQLTLAFRTIELGGEVGETLNILKKLERERLGIKGSRSSIGALADELADIVICCDLIGMHLNLEPIELPQAGVASNTAAHEFLALRLFSQSGAIALAVADHNFTGTNQLAIRAAMVDLCRVVSVIAAMVHVDLEAAVRTKFNKTSVSNNLSTRIAP